MGSDGQIATKAFVVRSPGSPFLLEDVILDEVRANEVLVEIKYTGLCHTDIVVQSGGIPVGDFPAVLGHEGMGIVRRLGSRVNTNSLNEGDEVLLSFSTCCECGPCKSGSLGSCIRFTEINIAGARGPSISDSPISFPNGDPIRGQFFGQSCMAKLAIVPETSIVKLNRGSALSESDIASLAPLGCGYLTGAGTVMNVLKPIPTSRFVILGMGAVGLSALMAAKAIGVESILAVDLFDSKLELAKSLGASCTLNTKDLPDLVQGICSLFPEGVDHILDTTGVGTVLESAIRALGHGGILAIVGAPPVTASVNISPLDLLMNCKRVVGAVEGAADPAVLLPLLVDWYEEGKFPVNRLAKVYPADQLHVALEDLHAGKVIKPVLDWSSV
ncbi:hypothetical protein N7539_006295 [Penicillium diatomitis]|uniref:Enoyl reductase (ER) domain-containing protein n=1 Tax=Penicillium diatomitis TaxID=2819901 RepID=A0A9W9X2U9_9EURO|nr:uncharacterized protein N7539_006295 [Penicillium diatomitis]KAJ5482849.1 hypothetical protein N7539_006295 [Penicillium diatomitis]